MPPEYQIFLSPLAIEQITLQLNKRQPAGGYLRLGIKGSGCLGYEYVLRFEEAIDHRDYVFQFGSVKVLVDPKSIIYLNGITLDYEKTLIKSGFKFLNNVHETKTCGCGSSFSVD
jgi:iron-sulfur cluster assembly protein